MQSAPFNSLSLETLRRRWPAVLLVLLMLAAAVFAAIWQMNNAPIPFTRAEWFEANRSHDETTRHRMSDALVQDGRLVGMTRLDVATMLGAPARHTHQGWDMTYILGRCRHPAATGTEMLVLQVDDAGIVTDVRIIDA